MNEIKPIKLGGKLLLSMPQIGDPRFERSVILMMTHDETGSLGFVLNQAADDITLGSSVQNLPETIASSPLASSTVFIGGPVQQDHGFILHSPEWAGEATISPPDVAFSFSQSIDVLHACAQNEGPEEAKFLLGYSGWGAGQLEDEIRQNAWLIVTADPLLVFSPNHETLYEAVAKRAGIDLAHLSSSGGSA